MQLGRPAGRRSHLRATVFVARCVPGGRRLPVSSSGLWKQAKPGMAKRSGYAENGGQAGRRDGPMLLADWKPLPQIGQHLPHVGRQRAGELELRATDRMHKAKVGSMEHHPRRTRLVLYHQPTGS